MTYKDFEIQYTSDGCIIRDKRGKYITKTVDEREAKEYISDYEYDEENQMIVSINKINWYDKFCNYCTKCQNSLPCYFDYYNGERKMMTTNKKVLDRFIKSFEKYNNVTIEYTSDYRGGEEFYIVTDVIPD